MMNEGSEFQTDELRIGRHASRAQSW